MSEPGWQFWIDRGGTFTDIVALDPTGAVVTHKLLSHAPERYDDAALQGIRDVLGLEPGASPARARIDCVKMGTTVATNALLQRRGERTALVVNRGFADALRIGYQNRPDIFARHIQLPEMLYERVIEIDCRVTAQGEVLEPVDRGPALARLRAARADGIASAAIVLMHGYRHAAHEAELAELAREAGFTHISVSHRVSPLIKLVGRGDTTIVDAYVSPLLDRYISGVAAALADTRLFFMQSNGGLADAQRFRGKDSILSGPAGGVVGAVKTAALAGFDRIIGFDMGGTSTDVSHYDGRFERTFENEVAGVRMRAPMMAIHTVAAGGGSILHFDGRRFRVGPDSAGADPGPACYRRGGPLTVTDCNVMLGKLDPRYFPSVFGPDADQPLDRDIVAARFAALAAEVAQATGRNVEPEEVAEGFLAIAIDNMANAIKKISIQRGRNTSNYTLCCFGGAGGQHACGVADALAMRRVLIHPHAGVLSALGMGLADIAVMRERTLGLRLDEAAAPAVGAALDELAAACLNEIERQGVRRAEARVARRAHLRYDGSDTALGVDHGPNREMIAAFEAAHRERFGFTSPEKELLVEMVSAEATGGAGAAGHLAAEGDAGAGGEPATGIASVFTDGARREAVVAERGRMRPGTRIAGPAIIVEPHGTNVVEPGWSAELTEAGDLVLERVGERAAGRAVSASVDPIMLEIFNNLFMSIAEQMGTVLENTAHSVNIKERLDFSCAVFNAAGELVANAPHMPVHLGSMSESVKTIIRDEGGGMRPGDVYALNAPYHGGTHIPDVTVIAPVFDDDGQSVRFYLGSRGHHADIGGITPGSMPPGSAVIEEEGVLIENFRVVRGGRFAEREVRELFTSGRYPARNPEQNIADLKAQIAACEKGMQELRRVIGEYGLDVVNAYMGHVQDNAEMCVRRVLGVLRDGACTYPLDDGSRIHVEIRIDHDAERAEIDFTGTSDQHPGNFNAPLAVTKAAVLYVFRTLVEEDIPLNEGCLKPLDVIVPPGLMLRPNYPAAVVAGNVETCQAITDALYGALGVLAGAQGTMNNLTFGNDRWQYYETVCGGSGAGPDFDGTDAVHTHMTNSRLTDPEILEWRFPVLLEGFAIRRGSGGGGRTRGGDGAVRRIRFLEPMIAAILSSHRKVPPPGAAGGSPGALGRNYVERADGAIAELSGTGQTEMSPGDVFVIETPGGGGFGPHDGERAGAAPAGRIEHRRR